MDLNDLQGMADGVDVAADDNNVVLTFPFRKKALSVVHGLKGATFNDELNAWFLPAPKTAEDNAAISKAIVDLRAISVEHLNARNEIDELVRVAGKKFVSDGAEIKISDFIDKSRNYVGPIIAVNSEFAAQFTGNGDIDGAGFFTVHQLDKLDLPVFKGDEIAVKYDAKFNGTVGDPRPVGVRLTESIDQEIDGVLVRKTDENFEIQFSFNPVLQKRIQRIDGAEFDQEKRVWLVSLGAEEYVARAVADMRREFRADQQDMERVERGVSAKLDSAKISSAFTKEGHETSGTILVVTDRFVAQHTGRNYVSVHRAEALSEKPEVGSMVKVRYEKGKGTVIPPREKSNSLSH